MSRIAYLDCFAGMSGDMLLGALVDAGWPLERLREIVARLALGEVSVEAAAVTKQGIAGTQITIRSPEKQPQRGYADLIAIIDGADIAEAVKTRARSAVRLLGETESRVHQVPLDHIHFHEVGAVDTIADIVGGLVGLEELGVTAVQCSPIPWSRGTVRTQHGLLPVPPPAVAILLEGLPVVGVDVEGEMVTPTGATLIRTLAQGYGPIPSMTVEKIGHGAGRRDWPDRPNLLRLVLGQRADPDPDDGLLVETLTVLACNLDDMNPQWYGPLMSTLLESGALDVWLTPAQMKKNRPATIMEVLCRPPDSARMRDLVLRHTTTLGVRQYAVTRHSVRREIVTVETPYGMVRLKIAHLPGEGPRAAPEHDDCEARAREHGVSLREVWLAALRAYPGA